MVNADGNSLMAVSKENAGKAGFGSPDGIPPNFDPMVSIGKFSNATQTDPTITLIKNPG